jgi:arylsulfatase
MKWTASGYFAVAKVGSGVFAQDATIMHDAEYYVLEAQHAEQWAEDDATVAEKLAAFRDENDGKPPNMLDILIDDTGFGDMGIPEPNTIRGYSPPAIDEFADEGMRLARIYTEPSCTPTR